jgi:hypothetical protein
VASIAKASRFQGYSKCHPADSVGGYNEFFDETTLSQGNQSKRLHEGGLTLWGRHLQYLSGVSI